MKMKKSLCGIVAVLLAAASLAGCGGNAASSSSSSNSSSSASSDSKSSETTGGDAKKIVFWYKHKGDEAAAFEKAISMYNESQSNYVVEGLSVTDAQKVIVALASSESPDVIEGSNQDVISYQANRLIDPLSEWVSKDGYDTSVYSNQGLQANTIDDTLYGIPMSSIIIQMYYNKDILSSIGYSEPPKTMEELYEMAEKATTLGADGNIDVIGYPLFPLASARQELIYAFGGRWWGEDGKTLTPESQGVLDSLNANVKFRDKYGIEKVQAFVATANTNRYTEKDMFFAGKQLFRFDGAWLSTMINTNNSSLNYGVTLVPGTKANPELRGTSRFETTSLMIPAVAAQKDGAWDFIKYLSNSEATKTICTMIGNLPALTSLWEDADLLKTQDFPAFIEALKTENGIQYPTISYLAKYTSLIDEHLDYVYNGQMTPEEAMKKLAEQAKTLQ